MWSNFAVTLALKFKIAVYHARDFDIEYSRLYVCVDILNYGYISHTFGVLLSGCIHLYTFKVK